jgi:hypothetical protein
MSVLAAADPVAAEAGFQRHAPAFDAVLGDAPRIECVVEVAAHEGPVYVRAEDALYFTTVPRPPAGRTCPRVDVARIALDGTRFPLGTGRSWLRETLGIEEYVDDRHAAAVPHTVVLGPNLEIHKIYVGFWFFGRPSVYDLWADMRDVRMRHDYNFDPLAPGVREEWEAKHPGRVASTRPKRKRARVKAAAG